MKLIQPRAAVCHQGQREETATVCTPVA